VDPVLEVLPVLWSSFLPFLGEEISLYVILSLRNVPLRVLATEAVLEENSAGRTFSKKIFTKGLWLNVSREFS